jgi:hypothetical protein
LIVLFTFSGTLFYFMRKHPGAWRKKTLEQRKSVDGDDNDTESVRERAREEDDVRAARLATNAWVGRGSRI